MSNKEITYENVLHFINKMSEADVVPTVDLLYRAFDNTGDRTLIEKFLSKWRNQSEADELAKLDISNTQLKKIQEIINERTKLLEKSIATYRATLECSKDGILVVNNEGKMVDYNERFRRMWKVPRNFLEERDDRKAIEHVMSQCTDPEGFLRNTINIYEDETGEGRVADVVLKSGETFERYSLPQTVNGEIIGRVWANRDVTEQRRVLDELRLQKRAIEANPNGIVILDILKEKNPIVFVNPAFEHLTGYQADEILNKSLDTLIGNQADQPSILQLQQAIHENRSERIEIKHCRKNGTIFWNELHIAPVFSSGQELQYNDKLFVDENAKDVSQRIATHYVVIMIDITERKAMEEQLLHQATHDALTNLPNRALLEDRVSRAIVQATQGNKSTSILFLDLDHFKLVNDSLGHGMGDKLLCQVATRINDCITPMDTVARIGGDEYIIVLNNVDDADDSISICEKVLKCIRKPFQIDGRDLMMTASIGVSTFPKDGETSEILLRNADTAMYQAKSQGRDNFKFYTKRMNQRVSQRLKLQNELHGALERNEFKLMFQPITHLKTEKIVGVESLLRWHHHEMGAISPAEFIPLAEDTGLIIPITEWVVLEACRQNMTWQKSGLPPISLAINISGRSLKYTNVADTIKKAIRKTNMDPSLLVVELTESVLMDKTEKTISKLNELKNIGITIAIDDFGTGYSSLSYLNSLPIDKLKIDKSFINRLGKSQRDTALVLTIISLAKNLRLKIVAEGVENEHEITFLCEHDCDEVQGYYYSKPLTTEQLIRQLIKNYQLTE